MIPTIEQIVADLIAGTMPQATAIAWLRRHIENAELDDLRDYFAARAMQATLNAMLMHGADDQQPIQRIAFDAYVAAAAMLKARAAK